MKGIKEFKPLLKLVKEEKTKLIIASIIIFASGLCEIFTGYLNGAAVEAITKLDIRTSLMYLFIYFTLEITMDGAILFYGNMLLLKVESSLTRKLGFLTYKKVLNLPSVAFEKTSSGEIINRITSDADTLSFTFKKLLTLISSLVASLIIIIYIFINSYIIGIEIIILVLIILLILKKYSPILKQTHKERKQKQDKFTSLTTETIRGIREVKTLGIRKNIIKEASNIIKEIYASSAYEIDIYRKFDTYTGITKSMLEVGVLITCIILLYYKKISLTFFVSMTYYIYRYTWLITNINDLVQNYQKVNVSLERVNEILENRLYKDEDYGNIKLKNVNGIIEFKNVSFSYPNEAKTLDNFSLKIEPNKKIAIVGASGQGKSTLFNLITRIFDVNSGEILIDGINVKDLTEESLRQNISLIRQEPFIFNRTIKENFKLVDRNIKLKEIREYCKMSYIDDYIMTLPKKYNTILGESGINLSGGQKQRLSIARSLCKKSKIILFDEATSALDNKSQEYIKKTIDSLVKDHTVMIVAHRLSTIVDADIIHVVKKGKVVDSGTHDELLEKSEIYRSLYKTETLNSN